MLKNGNPLMAILISLFASIYLCACSGTFKEDTAENEERVLFSDEAGADGEPELTKDRTRETESEELAIMIMGEADDISIQKPVSGNTPDQSQTRILEQYDTEWTEEKMMDEIMKRKPYLENCSFYGEVNQYMENVREVRDISVYTEYLFAADERVYSESDFENVPPLIIHLAKNEIYARHGYIFKDKDLNNYFCGQLWYLPSQNAEGFDDSVFNEYEKENLKLLSKLDNYKK